MKKKAIKILKSRIGLVSNSAFLIDKHKFYLLDTDFHRIEEIPFNEKELDGWFYIFNISNSPFSISKAKDSIIAIGDFSKLHREAKDLRFGLLGNEGLFYRYVLSVLEKKYNIYSFHACVLYSERKNILYLIVGGAGSGKTVFLLKGIEQGLQIFSTEMAHFQIEDNKVVFYKGSLADNIRIGNLKYDFPLARKMLKVKLPRVKNEWASKITVNMGEFQTGFDKIRDPRIVLVFPHIEKERKELIQGKIDDLAQRRKLIFDNVSQKPGETILLYERIPVSGLDNENSVERRLKSVDVFLRKARLEKVISLIGGAKNCLDNLK